MCSCHSILECCVTFSGVKLSIRLFVLLLMNLQPVFSDNDVARLRKFHNELETNHRALLSLGKKQEMYSDILVPQIENKLPQHLRITIL